MSKERGEMSERCSQPYCTSLPLWELWLQIHVNVHVRSLYRRSPDFESSTIVMSTPRGGVDLFQDFIHQTLSV